MLHPDTSACVCHGPYRTTFRLHLSMIFSLQSYTFSCIILRNNCNRQKKRTRAYNTHHRGCMPLFYMPEVCVNNPVPVSLLSGDRKPQIRFLGNHHSGSGNLYHKSPVLLQDVLDDAVHTSPIHPVSVVLCLPATCLLLMSSQEQL